MTITSLLNKQPWLDQTSSNTIAAIDDLCVLSCSGPDAETFLQGQLTVDVTSMTTSTATLAAYCDAKGRIIALFYLVKENDCFYLVINRSLVEATLAKLALPATFSKVTLAEEPALHCLMLCFDALPPAIAALGEHDQTVVSQDGMFYLSVPGNRQAALAVGTDEQLIEQLRHCEQRFTLANDDHWQAALIHAGIPSIHAATQQTLLPHHIHLDQLGGINFRKGCYVGQEIIARMHYLGKLKQHLYRASVRSNHPIPPGTALINAAEKNVGTVLDSTRLNEECYCLLATVRDDAIEQPINTITDKQTLEAIKVVSYAHLQKQS